jgi:hypothetical protein
VSGMASILDTVKPLIDRGASLATSTLSKVPGPAGAIARRLSPSGPAPKAGMSDPTLKSKVESTLYRVPGVTRSKVKVSVADGVVTIHGEARNQALMSRIETTVRSVPEVKGYESQLHLPKTPAPSTPKGRTRKTTTKKPASATKAGTRGRIERVSREKTKASEAEPSPTELAAKGEGRQPAPLGSTEPEAEPTATPSATSETTTATPAPEPTTPIPLATGSGDAAGSTGTPDESPAAEPPAADPTSGAKAEES